MIEMKISYIYLYINKYLKFLICLLPQIRYFFFQNITQIYMANTLTKKKKKKLYIK